MGHCCLVTAHYGTLLPDDCTLWDIVAWWLQPKGHFCQVTACCWALFPGDYTLRDIVAWWLQPMGHFCQVTTHYGALLPVDCALRGEPKCKWRTVKLAIASLEIKLVWYWLQSSVLITDFCSVGRGGAWVLLLHWFNSSGANCLKYFVVKRVSLLFHACGR